MKSGIMLITLAALAWTGAAFAKPVRQWTDATTGHRIVQITNEPAGAASLYFHQNSYTPQGDKMVISTPDGISVVTLADWSVTPLVKGRDLQLLFTGRRTRSAYYASRPRDDAGGATTIFAADIALQRRLLASGHLSWLSPSPRPSAQSPARAHCSFARRSQARSE